MEMECSRRIPAATTLALGNWDRNSNLCKVKKENSLFDRGLPSGLLFAEFGLRLAILPGFGQALGPISYQQSNKLS
jgi:hypothetical protein